MLSVYWPISYKTKLEEPPTNYLNQKAMSPLSVDLIKNSFYLFCKKGKAKKL